MRVAMRSSVSSSLYFYQCEFQLADHQYIHNLAIFFPRTVLITTYLSSLQIPKENKSWLVFTSKKNLPPCYFFFTKFVSKNFMGELQPWKYKKNSGVVWSFLGWWEWWVRLWVRFPTRNMMCFKFFCCKISRKNNFKKNMVRNSTQISQPRL